MAVLPSYLDRDGFAKYFSAMREGSDALTVYLLSVADESRWAFPTPRARACSARWSASWRAR